jgi:hypothetical protein
MPPDPAMRDWEACRHLVEAAILAAPAKRDDFQPRVPKADTVSNCARSTGWLILTLPLAEMFRYKFVL